MIKIGARKCKVAEFSEDESAIFLNMYHQQKNIPAIYHIGLIYNNKIVGMMTFGYPKRSKLYQFELLRLCFDKDYKVKGGILKMFNYFIQKYHPNSIISYCNYNYFTGNVYNKLGFTLSHISKSNKTIIIEDPLSDESKEKGYGTYVWNSEGKFGYIYLITDTLHNKQYVGQYRGYKLDEKYYGSGLLLLNVIKKHGISILKREILDYASSQKELSEKEIYYIEKYNTLYPHGYNLTLRKQGMSSYTPQVLSDEIRQKRSENAKELWNNEDYREKISKCRKETWKSNNHREKISIAMKARMSKSDEKQKLINGLKNFLSDEKRKKEWNEKRMKGLNTEECRKKLSAAVKGKHWYNNGEINVLRYTIPEGKEWEEGKIHRKKIILIINK